MDYRCRLPLLLFFVLSMVACNPRPSTAGNITPATLPPRWTETPSPTEPRPTDTPSPTLTPTQEPAGPMFAYFGVRDGHSHVFVTDLDDDSFTQITSGPADHGTVAWFPDGDRLLYSEYGGPTEAIWVVDRAGRNATALASGGNQSYVQPSLSPDGSRVAFFSTRDGHWALFLMTSEGKSQHPVTNNTVFESVASWAPDGSAIAFTPWHNTESPPFIGIALKGTDYIELTSSEESNSDPEWSPNGEHIAFRCDIRGLPQVCTIKPDGSELRQLTSSPGGNLDAVWSPDSRRLAFVSWRDSADPVNCEDGECNYEIYVMDADGSHQSNLTSNPTEDWSPSWSPDGSSIAFVSLRDEPSHPSACGNVCNSEIYVLDSDGQDVRRITQDLEPNWDPTWRPFLP